jgi:peptidoglycan/LPS O-acetylase OafA/YrhL
MRSRALDGLRGIAATAVVFFHALLHNDWPALEPVLNKPIQAVTNNHDMVAKVLLSLFNGWAAVTVFFVLSGCVLRLSLDRREQATIAPTAIGFAVARLLRLYPPVIACMILFYALGRSGIPGYPVFDASRLLNNATLWAIQMHGPSTTIQGEVLAVPFILAAWILCRTIGSAMIAFCIVYAVLAMTTPAMTFHLPNMHGWLLPFIVGLAIADPRLRPLFAAAPPVLWWLAGAGLLACRMFFDATIETALVAATFCAALLVGGLLHGQRGSLHHALERPAAQFLGRISFSLYLLNVPALYLIWAFTDRSEWVKDKPLIAGILIGLASLILTIPLAVISERWIERPATSVGHRAGAGVRLLFRSRSVVPPAAIDPRA